MAPNAEVPRDALPNDARLEKMAREAVRELLAAQRQERLKPAPSPARLNWRPILLWPLLTAAAAALVMSGPWNPRRAATVPAALWGTWTTTAPGYVDHGFALSRRTVTFYTGGPDSSTHAIHRVRSMPGEGETHYVLEYERLGEPYEFSFSYSPERGGVIAFGGQRDLAWHRSALLAGAGSR